MASALTRRAMPSGCPLLSLYAQDDIGCNPGRFFANTRTTGGAMPSCFMKGLAFFWNVQTVRSTIEQPVDFGTTGMPDRLLKTQIGLFGRCHGCVVPGNILEPFSPHD